MLAPLLLQVAGLATVVIAGLYRWHLTRFRSGLKDDLDILKKYSELFGEEDPQVLALRASIQQSMYRAYRQPAVERRAMFWGVICIVGAILNFTVERPPSLLAAIVGVLGFIIGTASVIAAVVSPRSER